MVEGVSDDVQQDEGGAAKFATPIGGTGCESRVQLLLGQIAQISFCCLLYSAPVRQQVRDRETVFSAPTVERRVLEIVNPAFLAHQDVNQLLPDCRMAEAGDRPAKEFLRRGCRVAKQEIESLVGGGVKFQDSRFSKHGWVSRIISGVLNEAAF